MVHVFTLVLKSIPSAKLIIIGDGPFREKVEERTESQWI